MSHDDAFEAEFRLLPLRPRPMHEELSAGYMARLSERLGTESPRALWAAIASQYGAGPNVLQQCLGLSDIEWQHLKGPWLRYCNEVDLLPVGLSRADFTLEVMRWCPQCLSESMHLRFQWCVLERCPPGQITGRVPWLRNGSAVGAVAPLKLLLRLPVGTWICRAWQ